MNKKLNHGTGQGTVHHEPSYQTPAKLSLLAPSRATSMLPEAPTPPPRRTVSVPFQWEEAPGKPRPCHTRSEPKGTGDVARTLELPPRLLFLDNKVSNSMPSPTTVLEGPYVGRATSFTTSYRLPKETTWNGNFGSSRWSGKKKNNGEENEGSFDSSSKVKITRVRRRGSFLRNSQGRSHLWSLPSTLEYKASIYESFKQVVPWRRGQETQKK